MAVEVVRTEVKYIVDQNIKRWHNCRQ